MAVVLDSVTVTRFSAFPITASSSSTGVYSASGGLRSSARFPESKGLKIWQSSVSLSLRSVTQRPNSRIARGGQIVCDAQDTVLDAMYNLGVNAINFCKHHLYSNKVAFSLKTAVPAVTDATWKSLVIESESPVLVEFWAPWCGPCRMIHPIIDELSKQYAGKLKCYKVNTDESPTIATQYGIRSIPTVMIFKNGEKRDAVIGAVPKSSLTSSIEKFL